VGGGFMNPLITDLHLTTINSPIIVALDFNNEKAVMELVARLDANLCKLKVGKELFTACGPKLVEKLAISGYKIFLDLKFHDIPSTVYKACKIASKLGIWMLNVHASGGSAMLEMAKQGVLDSGNNPLLVAVTVLTSMNQNDLIQIGVKTDISTHVNTLAKLALDSGLDGVVCSAHEAKSIKHSTHADFLTVSPAIRLAEGNLYDQKRIMTPKEAIRNQVDYLVIGRPITSALDPIFQLNSILSQISFQEN
jgi:orotidine-5'-phosphate decarboxylase